MSNLSEFLPLSCETESSTILEQIRKSKSISLSIGAREVIDLCAHLSTRLLNDPRVRHHRELTTLAQWLQKENIEKTISTHLMTPDGSHRMPSGIVFQIPPGNIDTLFVYTAVTSMLCGNTTVMRVSGSARPVQIQLITLLAECLEEAPQQVRDKLFLLHYDYNSSLTEELSSVCDMRLVWGGNETISILHNVALPPTAQDIMFGDRFSSAVLSAERYNKAAEDEKRTLVGRFYDDAYWFDQLACASPRLIVWIGSEQAKEEASRDFYARLVTEIEANNYLPDSSAMIAKLTETYVALYDLLAKKVTIHAPGLTIVELQSLEGVSAFKHVNYGYGLFLETRFEKLEDLIPWTERKDQVLVHWGFDAAEIKHFVEHAHGDGFDRIVPVGQALVFDPVWDGINLFDLMTRLVRVET